MVITSDVLAVVIRRKKETMDNHEKAEMLVDHIRKEYGSDEEMVEEYRCADRNEMVGNIFLWLDGTWSVDESDTDPVYILSMYELEN
jgi:hypothetical protein